MKQDYQSHFYHEFQSRKQDWDIGRWLRGHGITLQDLDNHPRIDDVILLINIRQSLWTVMTKEEQASWGGYWNSVCYNKNKLKLKALKLFENIAQEIIVRQQRIHQIRLKHQVTTQIKQIGTRHPNMDHDITAKGSCPPPVEHTAVDQRECRRDLAPWE